MYEADEIIKELEHLQSRAAIDYTLRGAPSGLVEKVTATVYVQAIQDCIEIIKDGSNNGNCRPKWSNNWKTYQMLKMKILQKIKRR
jgi:hypothetical protein